MLHIVLFQPDIPQNTGNIGRLCAVTGCRLHLVHPLGFIITDKHLRRAGMDYWDKLDLCQHADWQSFKRSPQAPARLWLFTTQAQQSFWSVRYGPHDGLLFGRETAGVPAWLHDELGMTQSVKVDQPAPHVRSLNLSTCAGIATYEALRQQRGTTCPPQAQFFRPQT